MRPVTPEDWAGQLSGPPLLTGRASGARPALVRRWRGTEAFMSQPPLDHHYVVLHLGGPKRVTRYGDGPSRTVEVQEGAITIVPAGARHAWTTEGPIDFAHLYVHPARFNHAVAAVLDRDPGGVTLVDDIGLRSPLVSQLMRALLAEADARASAGRAYFDTLADMAVAALARHHSTAGEPRAGARQALAPSRLRRVLELVEARLAEPLDLAALAAAAGVSRFHFSRAFAAAMGEPPLAYVRRRRVEAAKRLLRGTDSPLRDVARETGFASPSHFAARFKRQTGVAPSQYRRRL